MREETMMRRKRREKVKEELDTMTAEIFGKKRGVKLTKAQVNKALLKEMKKRKDDFRKDLEEDAKFKAESEKSAVITHRSFKCPHCGYHVSLEGSPAADESITTCTKCVSIGA